MMVEIESRDGAKQLIGVDRIRRVSKSNRDVSEVDGEPLAVIDVDGLDYEITLKHTYDSFRRLLDGGCVKIIRG